MLFLFKRFILLALLILSCKSFAIDLDLFNSGHLIEASQINTNFNKLKTLLKKYNIDISFQEVSSNEIINRNTLINNLDNLKTVVPSFNYSLDSTYIIANEINNNLQNFINQFQLEPKYNNISCEELESEGFSSGYYPLDFDGFEQGLDPVITYCDIGSIESGVTWTRFATINKDDELWNAFNNDSNLYRNDFDNDKFGIALSRFSDRTDGQDLEIVIEVDGVIKNTVFYDVPLNKSFNNTLSTGSGVGIHDGYYYRGIGETSYTRCESSLQSLNERWNWSISSHTSGENCGYHDAQSNGFLLHGEVGVEETANRVYGLGEYSANSFGKINFYVRKKNLNYPISCQHAYSQGLISSSGYYDIDIDSNGSAKNLYCLLDGNDMYTAYLNAGNNTRYNNKTVLNNGSKINSETAINNAGFSDYTTNNWNHSSYLPSTSYLTFYYSSTTTGYVQNTMPKWGGKIRTKFRATNGSSYYADIQKLSNDGNATYGKVSGNNTSEPKVKYIYRNNNVRFRWREYTSGVIGLYYIFIK